MRGSNNRPASTQPAKYHPPLSATMADCPSEHRQLACRRRHDPTHLRLGATTLSPAPRAHLSSPRQGPIHTALPGTYSPPRQGPLVPPTPGIPTLDLLAYTLPLQPGSDDSRSSSLRSAPTTSTRLGHLRKLAGSCVPNPRFTGRARDIPRGNLCLNDDTESCRIRVPIHPYWGRARQSQSRCWSCPSTAGLRYYHLLCVFYHVGLHQIFDYN